MTDTLTGINLPPLNLHTPDDRVVSTARIAMNGLDMWAAEASHALVGRYVVRTGETDSLYGEVCRIEAVAVASGASGFHLFIVAPAASARRGDEEWPRTRHAPQRARDNVRMLELGVTCELLHADDLPRNQGEEA